MAEPARKYNQVTKAVYERPWALTPSMLAVIEEIVRLRASGAPLSEEQIDQRVAAAANGPRVGAARAQGVAVIPIYGVIAPRMDLMTAMSGGTTVQGLTRSFREALADPDIGAIVFDVDSPGGSVDGITELANEIRAARGTKPMAAVADTFMASAAFWLASAADEVIASPSAEVGSIGIIAMHVDQSAQDEMVGEKFTFITAGAGKADGNEHEPLSDSARQDLQGAVDDFYALFTADVAAARGVTAKVISGDWKAAMFTAKKAKAAGLVDRVETFDATVRRMIGKANPAGRFGADAAKPVLVATTTHEPVLALATELDYSERLALAAALMADVGESTQKRLALRAEEGRSLSEAHWDLIGALAGAAGELPAKPAPEKAEESASTPPPQAVTAVAPVPFDILEAATRGSYQLPPREVTTP